MDSITLNKTIKHIMVSLIVGDTVGYALDTEPGFKRAKRFNNTVRSTKSSFPAHDNGLVKAGTCSHHSLVLVGLFKSLTQKKPVNWSGIPYESKLFGASFAVGLYSAMNDLSHPEFVVLRNLIKTAATIDSDDAAVFDLLAWLMYVLPTEGYLRAHHLTAAIALHSLTGPFAAALQYLCLYQFDRRFIGQQHLSPDLVVGLTPYEATVVRSLFYLFQTFTGWSTKPRFALDGVMVHEVGPVHDLLFVFAGITTASEHNYLLFTKPLQEASPLACNVTTMFAKLRV